MKPLKFIIVFFILFPLYSFSQNEKSGNDQSIFFKTIDSLNALAFQIKSSDVPKALNLLTIAKRLSEAHNYHKGLSDALYNEAGVFQQNGYNKRARLIYEIGLENSIEFADTINISRIKQQFAKFYVLEGKYADAIKLYDESMQISLKQGPPKEIANIKNSLGLLELKRNNLQKADSLFKESLQLSVEIKFEYGQKKAFYNLGLLAKAKNDTATARLYFNNSFSFDLLNNDYYGMSLNQLALTSLLINQQKDNESILMAKKGYTNAKKAFAYTKLREFATILISQYQKKNDHNNLLAWQDSLINILILQNANDAAFANDYIEIVKEKNTSNEASKSEIKKANKKAKTQYLIIILVTLLLLALAFLVFVSFMSYRKQKVLTEKLLMQNNKIKENAESLEVLNEVISLKNKLLEDDNLTKDTLLSVISHDLRSPITNTRNILNLINKGILVGEDAKLILTKLEIQYANTSNLLDNLLNWLKSQITKKEIELRDIKLYELINSLYLEQRLSLVNKQIEFINNISNDATILTEKEMAKIIFRNFITNAIKFTPQNGTIEVLFYTDNDFNYIVVKDSGIGMDEEILNKVNAQKYFTRNGTAQEKGSGFGLILCRDLVLKQGGVLTIQSEKGEGSQFTVKLPV
ncbi:MAG: tetratricopeptide repeat-containing sensor histidine kinase [Bacteroidetes bacterium]|nr:tetratricopeptide repeat-containing sensor histidine kinase [Bacteroidota bacterium]